MGIKIIKNKQHLRVHSILPVREVITKPLKRRAKTPLHPDLSGLFRLSGLADSGIRSSILDILDANAVTCG